MALLWLFAATGLAAGKVINLPQLARPAILVADYDKLYILEKTTIYIYSAKDYKLIKKFGREGEGPREFKTTPFGPPMNLCFSEGRMTVNSMNKITFLTPEGEYKSEIKAPPNLVFYPIKDKYVAVGPAVTEDRRFIISLRLLDAQFKAEKLFHRTEVDVGNNIRIELPFGPYTYRPIYKDRIYIASSITDFVIDVYQPDGKKLYQIKKSFAKVKVPDSYKSMVHQWFKTDPQFRRFYDGFKNSIIFKEHYPAMRDMLVAEDAIYVITYSRKGDLWELVAMDLKGKELKRTFVPLSPYIPYTYYPILFTVYQGKFYSLIENEDEEGWDLHIIDL